ACRMCVIEDQWGNLDAACSAQPKAGMEIRTNTERLRKYRKMILELLLANHCRDCTTCETSGSCKLQDLATRFKMEGIRFPNTAPEADLDSSSLCIVKDMSKCVLCGDCVRMCDEVQSVGAIDFAGRGSSATISTAFNQPISESGCVGCGQCAAICPTGALIVRNDTQRLWKDINDKDTKVTAQIAPAVRVAIGGQLGLSKGKNAMGRVVAALRRIGFDEVFDTSTGADLTVMEESQELLDRLAANPDGTEYPLFTSCCPAWVSFAENNYPEVLQNVSTCRSPIQMLAAVIKEQHAKTEKRMVHVSIVPCSAKKFEAARPEFTVDGVPRVDYTITTNELIQMIKEAGIVFSELEPEAVDFPLGFMTGSGVIFGVTGGVTEAVLRRITTDKSFSGLRTLTMSGVRGMEGVKEASLSVNGRNIRIAMVSGLKNVRDLIEAIKGGERYDFVEVMACPGGCVSGAGQPYVPESEKIDRGKSLYTADKMHSVKLSEENPLVQSLYKGILKGREHELLHVHYGSEKH
ncbi:MAG: [FeFe] hydrogenase, group A, partial [Defluviitaleaceae bacterium]|nr:[FeFe] hydrogenase, group A [Defluviitaleaceae bacterium]